VGHSVPNDGSKGDVALGMIKRSFPVINNELFLVFYSVYVRPHLKYCVQVWAPNFQKDIKNLKLVKAIKKWSHEERHA